MLSLYLAAWVCKSSSRQDESAEAKRSRDGLARSGLSTVAIALPQGNSKGQEHVESFQVSGGALVFKEVRVLANAGGKGNPESPLFSGGRSDESWI